MNRKMTSMIALCASTILAGPALADCKEELSDLRGQMQTMSGAGISKDGTLAPLESADGSTDSEDASGTASTSEPSDSAQGGNEIAKDGETAPLETDLDSIATSGQQAQAQQDGASDSLPKDVQDALNVADAALEAGDERACMEAVKEARNNL